MASAAALSTLAFSAAALSTLALSEEKLAEEGLAGNLGGWHLDLLLDCWQVGQTEERLAERLAEDRSG